MTLERYSLEKHKVIGGEYITETQIETINQIVQKVAENYNYKTVNVVFVRFNDFKVQWQRSYDWIEFRISDYFKNVPEHLIEPFFVGLFEKILNGGRNPYPKDLTDFFVSDDFYPTVQKGFISRKKHFTMDKTNHDLDLIVQRLEEKGLISLKGIKPLWVNSDKPLYETEKSLMGRIVGIPAKLNSDTIPAIVVEYVVYLQCDLLQQIRNHFINHIYDYELISNADVVFKDDLQTIQSYI